MKETKTWSQILAFSAALNPELTPASRGASMHQLDVSGLAVVCFPVPLSPGSRQGQKKSAQKLRGEIVSRTNQTG